MSSFMDQIIAPYLTSPLANSTKIHNTVYTNGPDMSLRDYYNRSTRSLNIRDTITSTENSFRTISTSTDNSNTSPKTPSVNESDSKTPSPKATTTRKSVGGKKPVVSRKAVTVKKSIEPIKVIAKNYNYKDGISVERILKQINMTKYHQAFKKIDVTKFKDLKEIDLNAIGITRPSEIRTFMDAIKKVNSNMLVFKQN